MKGLYQPSKQIHAQVQQQKHYKKVWNILKVKNKGTKTTPMTSYFLVSLFSGIFIVNFGHFLTFSSVSIVVIEQVNVYREQTKIDQKYNTTQDHYSLWACCAFIQKSECI